MHGGGDATGRHIQQGLTAALVKSPVEIHEHSTILELITENVADADARITGVIALVNGQRQRIDAESVILATGGIGQLYSATTNSDGATGDGVGLAWQAGAVISDAEFLQFHPTVFRDKEHFLISEAVRGEGASLIDQTGRRFMVEAHPLAELAPCDVVAREVHAVMKQQHGKPVFLDARTMPVPSAELAAFLRKRFPTIDARCRDNGYDWSTTPIPITPAAHYWMGGILTDADGRTNVPGLFAAGEVARTGLHGANRLASNSLLEAVVFGLRTAQAITDYLKQGSRWSMLDAPCSTNLVSPVLAASVDPGQYSGVVGEAELAQARTEIQTLACDAIGIVREEHTLTEAIEKFTDLSQQAQVLLNALLSGTDHQLITRAAEKLNLAQCGLLIAHAAQQRRESRGAHFRSDHPTTRAEFAHSFSVVFAHLNSAVAVG